VIQYRIAGRHDRAEILERLSEVIRWRLPPYHFVPKKARILAGL
jgi:hypothetical protein